MARTAGISGVGVAVATAGALLMYAGIRDVPILDALRQVTGGTLPEGNADRDSQPSASASAARAVLDTSGSAAGGYAGAVQVSAGGAGFAPLAQAALRYRGRPYGWGATGPDRFDCSGLVQRSFADVGIAAPRTTYQQQAWRALSTISAAAAAEGDLVFWPGHVAIVVAPGMVVHAPRPGKVVEVVPVGSAGPRGTTPTYKRYTAGGGAAPRPTPAAPAAPSPPKSAQV